MSEIDRILGEGELRSVERALEKCLDTGLHNLGVLLTGFYNGNTTRYYRVASELNKRVKEGEREEGGERKEENVEMGEKKVEEEGREGGEWVRSRIKVIETTTHSHPSSLSPTPTHISPDEIRVLPYCNWDTSENLCKLWNKMSKGDYKWNRIRLVWNEEDNPHYYVVVNSPPPSIVVPKDRTIVFRMEPNMERAKERWGEWASPSPKDYLWLGLHSLHYNNNEWHLSKTYNELRVQEVVKYTECDKVLSTVLSDKYYDPGHIKRVDFVKFLESKGLPVHVYGGNKFEWKNYKGSPPSHCKDTAMFPYKYTFNVENQSVPGYYSEKLIDGILAETLVFYHGCPNIKEYFDDRAFVWLELSNFESDYKKIKRAIEENLWEERLPYIREAKRAILEERQFFPRIEGIILSHMNGEKE